MSPYNRDAILAEKLAGVKNGTYERFETAREEIATQDLSEVLSAYRESTVREQYNIMRTDPELRIYHDFSQNWFGKLTAETVLLLEKLGFVEDGIITPGVITDEKIVKALLHTQGIKLPPGVSVKDLGGLEWNERLALQLGRIRNTGR